MAQKNKKKKFKKFQNKPRTHSRQARDGTSDSHDSDSESSGSGFEEVSSNHTNVKMKASYICFILFRMTSMQLFPFYWYFE